MQFSPSTICSHSTADSLFLQSLRVIPETSLPGTCCLSYTQAKYKANECSSVKSWGKPFPWIKLFSRVLHGKQHTSSIHYTVPGLGDGGIKAIYYSRFLGFSLENYDSSWKYKWLCLLGENLAALKSCWWCTQLLGFTCQAIGHTSTGKEKTFI